MSEEIKIDVALENDLFDKFNKDKLSQELLEYIIDKASLIKDATKIKIVISETKYKNLKEKLLESFEYEYEKTIKVHHFNNILQLLLFILGILFIFFSTRITESVWKEILLIGGWVPIWEMIELELFNDFRGRKRKKILAKLLKSEIIYQ